MSLHEAGFQEGSRTFCIVGDGVRQNSPAGSEESDFVDALRECAAGMPSLRRLQVELGDRHRLAAVPRTAGNHESFIVLRGEISAPNVRAGYLWQTARSGVISAMAHLDDIATSLKHEVAAALHGVPLASRQELDVVLDPWVASQFIHETIGHTLEQDNFSGYGMQAGWHMGMTLGCDMLHVADDPTLPGIRGGYLEDDEGSPAERVPLVESGRVVGTLTSRRWGPRSNGHGRISRIGQAPLPRVAITTVEAGPSTRDELIAGVEHGILCGGVWGGGSQGDTFVVRPVYARLIRNGKLTDQYLRRLDLAGNKRRYLSAIDGVADDVRTFQPRYGCVKDDGGMIPVSFCAPTLRMRAVPIVPISK
jgi:TldD protein